MYVNSIALVILTYNILQNLRVFICGEDNNVDDNDDRQ